VGKGNFFGERGAHCKVYGHSAVTCAKIAEPIVMQFGLWALSASRNHEIDGGSHPPRQEAIFGESVAHCIVERLSAVSCKETAEPIDLPLRLWTRVC